MSDLQFITDAIFSLFSLSALIVIITQLLKNYLNKDNKKWISHLLSFITSTVCNSIVLLIGVYGNIGIFSEFITSSWVSWVMFICIILCCTGISNGLWTYDFMKKFLQLLGLIIKIKIPQVYESDYDIPQTPEAPEDNTNIVKQKTKKTKKTKTNINNI